MNNIVLSTRIRLARNFDKFPFVTRLNKEGAEKIIDKVTSGILGANNNASENFTVLKGDELKNKGGKLIEEHLISPDILKSKLPSACIISKDKETSIMVNEEDHLRIQVIKKGYNLDDAYKLCNMEDDLIGEQNPYAFSKKYGYLTACPTNVGTGLRGSLMIHIPGISLTKRFESLKESLSKLGITIRGFYGEGTDSIGNIYQISNTQTLGVTEEDILKKLKLVTDEIITQEKEIRENLKNDDAVIDLIMRSLGIAKHCHLIDYKEFSTYWSYIMLGMDMGIIDNKNFDEIKNLIFSLAPNSLNEENTLERDKLRAKILNEKLAK